jgi:hypothetical protein
LEKLTIGTDPARENEQSVKIEETQFNNNPVPMDRSILDALSSMTPQQMLSQNDDLNHPPFELDEDTIRSLQQFIESQGLHQAIHTSDQVALIFFI